jgi:4-amino-4-deoxy-L-arabinose transferase-like glycosyltransferase
MKRAQNQNSIGPRQRLRLGPIARLEILLFLCLWLGYGSAINSDNLFKFNLQQIGVEAIVERHQFYLEGSSVPELWPGGDVFFYQSHKFAAKQPGQSMAGAIVYWVLHVFGLRYANNYLLTSALVTFFTTSLILAASAIAVFRISRRLTKDRQSLFWPLLTTFAYALATTIFAYSGIAHHDALATGCLVLAFYLIFDLPRAGWDGRGEILRSAGAGFLLGLAITTSMLVPLMAIVCVLYFFWLRRWKLIPLFVVALLFGLLPLFVYDARSFGNPFLLPNVAGAHLFADTFFRFSAKNFGDKLVWYSMMLLVYAPVFLAGVFGLSYYPRDLRRAPFFPALLAMLILLAAYILNIQTAGDCQFGPRYLLPAMPFACLGLAGYSYLSTLVERRFAGLLVLLVTLLSFAINLIGAVQGAMNCPDGRNALRDQLTRLARGEMNYFPLAPWLLAPLIICVALFAWSLVRIQSQRSADILSA